MWKRRGPTPGWVDLRLSGAAVLVPVAPALSPARCGCRHRSATGLQRLFRQGAARFVPKCDARFVGAADLLLTWLVVAKDVVVLRAAKRQAA